MPRQHSRAAPFVPHAAATLTADAPAAGSKLSDILMWKGVGGADLRLQTQARCFPNAYAAFVFSVYDVCSGGFCPVMPGCGRALLAAHPCAVRNRRFALYGAVSGVCVTAAFSAWKRCPEPRYCGCNGPPSAQAR